MEKNTKTMFALVIGIIYILSLISFSSALSVDADYITIYPGEQGSVKINVENNNNYDIEEVSVGFVLSTISPTGELITLPFSALGSSEKTLDDLNDGDDDSATFTLKASTDITPGDYNIPYVVKYKKEGENTTLTQEGSFGIRVSARTDIDFSLETSDNAIIGKQGQVTLEIINKGLGEIKSVDVEFLPNGFDLLSKNKIFIGTIDAEDSDTASFDVIYKSANPTFTAQISYKDFDNQDQVQTISLPVKVYTEEQAKNLGLVTTSRTGFYILGIFIVLIIWYFWRRSRKKRKEKKIKERSA